MSKQKSKINPQKSIQPTPKDLCRLLFETASEAILVIQEGRVIDCNTKARVILGVDPTGRSLLDLLPSTSPEGDSLNNKWQTAAEAALAGEQPRLVWRLSSADQAVIWIEITLNSVEFEDDFFIQALLHDITPYKQTEDILRQQEKQYRHLIETSHDLIWSVDAEGRWTFVNQAVRHVYGYEPEEILGRPFMDFETPEQREKDLAVFARILAGESFFQYETEHIRKDGTPVILSFNAIVLRDEQGKVLGTTGTATDITARRRAEETAAQERNLLQTIVDHLPAHIYVKDTEGRFVFGNAATQRSLGVNSLDELVGKTDFDFSPHELAAQFQADEQALFEAGQSPVYKEDTILDQVTGEQRWVATTKVLLQDDHGQVASFVGINFDITERRSAEEELRRNQFQLKRQTDLMDQVQAAAKVGGWEIDLVNNSLYWTAETYRLHEVSPDEYTPSVETAINYYAPESIPIITFAVNRAIETGEPWDHELELITAKGRRIWVRAIGRAEFNAEGHAIRIFGSFQDITDRRRLELQIRASLERQARQLRLLTLVAQQTVAVTDLNVLFERIVAWTKEQLGFYHVQLFRYEPDTQLVKLVAAYGELGARMLAANYQVTLGQGLIGAAAASGISILEPDIANALNWQPNPYLPQTKGELVVPIKSGREDTQAQIATLQHFIDSDFDGLIVSVINRDLVTPITQKATRQNIPVVFFTSASGSEEQTAFVSTSEHEMGYILGLQAGAWAKEHIPTGQSLKVAILSYRTLPQLVEREEGMIAGLKQNFEGDLELVASETASDSAQGLFVAEQWLKSYPDLQMILGINDVGALGAYQAVVAAGKDDPNQFFVGGIDAIEEALSAIKKGGAYQATVDLHPREAGAQAVRSLVSLIKGQSYQKVSHIKPRPVNKTNLEVFLHQNEQMARIEQSLWEEDLAGLDSSGIKIGLSIVSLSNPFYMTLVDGVRAEAERLGVELVINEARQVLGVLAVQSDKAGTLDTEDQLTLEGVAGQLASAIESTRLLEQTRVFQQLAETAGQGFSMATPDSKIVYNNPANTRILELSHPEENYGQSFITLYPETLQRRLEEEIMPVVVTQGQWQGELVRQLSDGRTIPTFENISVIRDEKGELKYWVNIFSDISEQKQAEAELQARLEELNTLQRLMSREGWQAFQATHQATHPGYLFDHTQVLPIPVDRFELGQTNGEGHSEGNGHALTRPVTVQGEPIGQIGVYTAQSDTSPLSSEDQEFLDAVAEQVAEALERARLLEQAQRRVAELETVAQVGTIASTTLEPEQLLQTVVDLTKRSFNLYQVHIYLLEEMNQNLALAAATGEVGRQMLTQGWQIALEQENSLVAQAARTRRGVTVNDVQTNPNFLPNPLLPKTRSEMAVPLIAGNKLLGILDIQADVPNRFTREDIRLQTTLATQIAVALENARLFAQTQTALAETETLYDLTGMLSSATTLEEALQTMLSPFQSAGFNNAILLAVEPDEHGRPVWAKVVVAWDRPGQQSAPPLGTRFYLPDFPFANYWIENPDEPALVEDIFTDSRIDPKTRVLFEQSGVRSSINLQLHLGQRWMGLVSLTWSIPQQFTDKDRRLCQSLAAQMAVVMNNLVLLDETQQRATQLEKLSNIETGLSQAQDEAEILATVAQVVEGDPAVRIILQYLETDEAGHPLLSRNMASWNNGAIWPEDPSLGVVSNIKTLPTTPLWVQTPPQALFVSDTHEDPRIDKNVQEFATQVGMRAFVILPLYSAGSWQGNMTFTWPEPHLFTENERFMLGQLLEPVSAMVATRRAYLAAEEARHVTENLYNATRRVNETTDLQEIVAAIAEDGPVRIFNRALLFLFEYNAFDEVESIVVAANWYSGQGRPPTEIGARYSYRALDFVGSSPLFFDDIQLDPRASSAMQELARRLEFKAAAALPLWTSTRQLGTLFFEAEESYQFLIREVQPYVALARQVAIAIENQQLLEETRLALAEVEVTQRRFTLQSWEAYQNRTPVRQYEKVDEGVAPLSESLPSGLAEAVELKQVTVVTRTPLLPGDSDVNLVELPENSNQEANLLVPLTVRDEVIGVLGLQEVEPAHQWLPEEIELVRAIAEEIALAAENIRLLDDTQQRAAREQRVNEIGEKIRAAQTLEEALQIAVKEVGLSLKAPQTAVKLEIEDR